jgi:hypothetical protein
VPGPILNFNSWNRLNESSQKLRFDQIYEADTPYTPENADQNIDPKDLATQYRIWANGTAELKKKYGKESKHDLDLSNPLNPNNSNFQTSWDEGGGVEFMKTDTYKTLVEKSTKRSDDTYRITDKQGFTFKISDAVNFSKTRKGLILAYFWRLDSDVHKKFFDNVLKNSVFTGWTDNNKLTLYSAQLSGSPEEASKISNIQEYETLSRLFGVTSLPIVKIIKPKDEGGGKITYEVIETKSYKGEAASSWCNSFTGFTKYEPKSASFDKADYDAITKKMTELVTAKDQLMSQVSAHLKIATAYNAEIRTSIEGLDQTLRGLIPNLKLSCDLKYNQFWKKKSTYLQSLLDNKDKKIAQGERDIVVKIINSLKEMYKFCDEIEAGKTVITPNEEQNKEGEDEGLKQNLKEFETESDNPKKSKGGEYEDKNKASLFDDEIVRSGLDSKKKKKDTFKDKLKRGANWAMNNIVDRN